MSGGANPGISKEITMARGKGSCGGDRKFDGGGKGKGRSPRQRRKK